MHDSDWTTAPFQPKPTEVQDPVCGTWLEPRHSAATRTTHGKSVFFCSSLCLEKFDLSPEHYLHEPEPEATRSEAAR